jgi:outer membrane protein OmpA-like peptidoglycan-associated protein
MPQPGPQPHGPHQPACTEHARRSGLKHGHTRTPGVALLALLLTTGCHHRDLTDSTMDLVQHMRGGVVAEQRPPPPGQYSPYPHVGLTPTTAPSLPSPQARKLLTSRLIRDRNLTYRTMAANGTLLPTIPPPPSAAEPAVPAAPPPSAPGTAPSGQKPAAKAANQPAALPEGVNGAIMDAASAPPPPPPPAATAHAAPAHPAPAPAPAPAKSAKPADSAKRQGKDKSDTATKEVAMPEVSEKNNTGSLPPDAIPSIPNAPPPAPEVGGAPVPPDMLATDAPLPAYDLNDVPGTGFHFLPQSDELSPGQDDELAKLLRKTPRGPFFIRGFGNAASMSAQDQSDAVRLGLLRATRLARILQARGVPASALHVRGDAFGTGAKVANTP